MDEKIKARIMDTGQIRRVLNRIATEIIERNRSLKNVVIVGIQSRGINVSRRIAGLIEDLEGVKVPVGVLDISSYRDDLGDRPARTAATKSKIGFPVTKRDVILVDDVLMTGRTVRAAMDGLVHLGRPRTIQLLVLIDRGHRELPIAPDYVGRVLPTSHRETVKVRLKERDGVDEVLIAEAVKLR